MDKNKSDSKSWTEKINQFDPRATIALRDLSKLKVEKTIVMALIIQFAIAAFSSILVFGLVAVYDTGTEDTRVGITGEATDKVIMHVEHADGVEAFEFEDGDSISEGVSEGVIEAGVIAEYDGDGLHLTIAIPDEDLATTMIVTQLQGVTENIENEQRQQVATDYDVDVLSYPDDHSSNPYYTFTYTVLIPLLIFLPIFISGSVVVDSITEEIDRGTLLFLETSPADLEGILDGKSIAATILAPAQIGLWIVLLYINGIVIEQPLWILLYATSITIGITAVGVWISLVLRTRQHSQLAYAATLVSAFSVLSILPQSPANIVARLSTSSATVETYIFIILTTVICVGIYGLVRRNATNRDRFVAK